MRSCCSPQRPPRLGRVAQRIAEPGRLGTDLLLSHAHAIDQAGELAKGIDTLGFKRRHLLLVTLEPLAHGREQRLELLLAALLGHGEPLLRALEERLLRAFENFGASDREFLFQHFLRVQQQPLLLIEVRGVRLERRQLRAQRLARGAQNRQLGGEPLGAVGASQRSGEPALQGGVLAIRLR